MVRFTAAVVAGFLSHIGAAALTDNTLVGWIMGSTVALLIAFGAPIYKEKK